jgi:hypothetical protein
MKLDVSILKVTECFVPEMAELILMQFGEICCSDLILIEFHIL